MLSFFASFFVAAAITSVYATPLTRLTCTPNAQGYSVSIVSVVNSVLEWGVESTPANSEVLIGESFRGLAAPDFHVQQSGQDPDSFVIKDIDNSNLAVTALFTPSGFLGDLVFSAASESGNQTSQLFDIACQNCGSYPGYAAGTACTIILQADNNFCAQPGTTASASLITTICNGSTEQLWNLVF
ncbi:hypothetical protein BT96DRAFT_1081507 [Gymnopus androsaceus JB14]|uniref:Ricin B lectin domain-containing protein n=1 Tax=Gymnopus androsaceus JB14 TaxID=1447944 RepID=A0A6A4GNC1_9AGAR|nr:hypothetical protein BT96DRAFT_1081507 [Gymnopus androsaceus JB14]